MRNIKNLLHSFFSRSTFAPVQGLRASPLSRSREKWGEFSVGVLSRTRGYLASVELGCIPPLFICSHSLPATDSYKQLLFVPSTNISAGRRHVSKLSEVTQSAARFSDFGCFVRPFVPRFIPWLQPHCLGFAAARRKRQGHPSVCAQVRDAVLVMS